jgi:hypothetical protein
MYDQESAARNRSPADSEAWPGSTATADRPQSTGNGQSTTEAVKEKVGQAADVAKEDAGTVAREVRTQASRVAADVRQKVGDQARTQQENLAGRLRRASDDLREMAGERDDSPARVVVSQLADRSARVADYLADRGPEGLLADVQSFARRRPAAFLVGAAVAGFLVGRVGKSVVKAQSTSDTPGTATGSRQYATSDAAGGWSAPAAGPTAWPAGTESGTAYAEGTTYPESTTYAEGTAAPTGTTYASGSAEPVGTAPMPPTTAMPPFTEATPEDYHVAGQAPVPESGAVDPRTGGDRT